MQSEHLKTIWCQIKGDMMLHKTIFKLMIGGIGK